jgi:hypothetical protein
MVPNTQHPKTKKDMFATFRARSDMVPNKQHPTRFLVPTKQHPTYKKIYVCDIGKIYG